MTYGYDNADRVTSVTDWNTNAVTYAYDDAGRLTSKTLPSGTAVVSSYTYDNADRLTAISHVKNGSTTLASVNYTLDAVGNRTQRVDQQGTHTYAYDNVYRLTSVTYPGPSTTTYAYDAFGNRTSMTKPGSQTTTYAYNDGDRLTSVTPPGQSAISYTWDNNGNLTARGSDSFAWDYEDRMTSATVGGTTTTFAYRGDGLRNSRTVGGNTTTFTWDINAGLPVILDDGSQYIYGRGLEAMKQAGSWYYYLEDGLGSTMAIVDSTGTIQKSYTYDVYGKPTPTGTLANEFDFAGQQTDGTGLQYLRARYMDPELGRFGSREPLAARPAWTGNPYGYASGNPAGMVDPTGLTAVDTEGFANTMTRHEIGVTYRYFGDSGYDLGGALADAARAVADAGDAAVDYAVGYITDPLTAYSGHQLLAGLGMAAACPFAGLDWVGTLCLGSMGWYGWATNEKINEIGDRALEENWGPLQKFCEIITEVPTPAGDVFPVTDLVCEGAGVLDDQFDLAPGAATTTAASAPFPAIPIPLSESGK